ncbi:restriction endonuclease subunit S [Hafnia alvei]|uniref:restriction endonuclease subunit S n=1 Tax=Hafnia alvei TaxID=569 RepID=UPI0010337E44|nr:restriction endonuclease subunit S [Hafnia alvei]TBL88366.1 restriction endonuclease subunit S [Hafnia alvei]
MAVEKLITDHIDIWSSALQTRSTAGRGSNGKIDLYGIKKLRELILELAVRGKLVPQDPNDEPASELLKRIAAEKAELVKQGKIKKQKPLPEISEDEKPFELPVGWEWVRLNDLAPMSLFDGDWIESKDQDPQGNYRLIQLADIGVGEFKDKSERYINAETFSRLNCNQLSMGDILIARLPSPIGRACIYPGLNQPAITVVDVAILRPSINYKAEYLVNAINSNVFREQVESFGKGATRFRIATGHLKSLLIPVSPFNEQNRLVARVYELLSLCDQLEQKSLTSLDAHQKLVETLLSTLTDSQNAEELAENWARISQHFDTLFTTKASIDALKQTILQLAVMGKLVPQDPSDEPASELLKRIEQEKAQLVKEGKIKKQKPLPPVSDEEKPFELPQGWEWCRVSNIAMFTTSGSRDWAKYYSEKGALFVTMGNLSRGSYDLRMDNIRYVSPPTEGEGLRTRLEAFDLIISITGDVGNLGLIPDGFGEAYINQHTCLLRFIPTCQNYYFAEFMRSPVAKVQFAAPQRGIKNSFRLSDVEEMYLPLPPLKEQYRIAEKIKECLSICDQIKSRLQSAQQTQLHLADALTDAALN